MVCFALVLNWIRETERAVDDYAQIKEDYGMFRFPGITMDTLRLQLTLVCARTPFDDILAAIDAGITAHRQLISSDMLTDDGEVLVLEKVQENLLSLLQRYTWLPRTHQTYPPALHKGLFNILLAAGRSALPRLPPELWSEEIFPYLSCIDFL